MRARTRVAVALGLAAFLTLTGTVFASASWQATSTTSGSVTAASTSMTISGTTALDTQYKFTGSTSPTLIRSVVVKNTGATPLNYALAVSGVAGNALAGSVAVSIWTTTGTCSISSPGSNIASGTLASLPALPSAASYGAPGAVYTLCITTKLTTTVAASQGLTVTPIFAVNGVVGTSSWTASAADAAFTQSVYRAANPSAPVCKNVNGFLQQTATISWTAPTGTTGTVTYSIVDATTGATVSGASISGTTASFNYGDLNGSSETILVRASEPTYGTTSAGLSFTLSQNPGIFGILLMNVSCVSPAAS